MNLRTVALLVAALLLLIEPATAADDAKRRAAFREGVAAIQAEKWDEAVAIYRKLWEEERTYDVALSLGQAELNSKKYRDAAEHLDFGLRTIPPREDAAVSERARHMLDVAKHEVGTLELKVDRTNAEVVIDGKAAGTTPPPPEIFVEPGPHTIEATSSGSTPIVQAISIGAGQQKTLNLVFGERGASSSTSDGAPAR